MIRLRLPENGKKAQCDCLASTTYSVICNFGKNYLDVFALFWGFQYKTQSNLTWNDSFERGGLIQQPSYTLKSLTGVEVCRRLNDGSLSVMKRTIQSYTEKGLPVGIQLDAYECPWNVAYKHVHFHHYVLALGYQDGILFCQDPFCYIDKIALHADAQLKIGRDYYTYKIHNTKELHPNERIILLKESIRYYLSSKSYENIVCFANEIPFQREYFEELRKQQPIIVTPFFIKWKSIVSDRINFLSFLQCCASKMPDKFIALVNAYRILAKYWNDTYLLWIKTISRSINLDALKTLKQRLLELADKEYSMARVLDAYFVL
jgi:hypothetical protein